MRECFHLVIDVSGSTVRRSFHDGWVRALPAVVDAIPPGWAFSVISYSSDAALIVTPTPVTDLVRLPTPPPGGFSSLAAAFRLLAATSEGARSRVLVVADGLPTDRDEVLLAARDEVEAQLHIAVSDEVDLLPVAGLRAIRHRLDPTGPAAFADSLVQAAKAVLA